MPHATTALPLLLILLVAAAAWSVLRFTRGVLRVAETAAEGDEEPLTRAARRGPAADVERLLAEGADPDLPDGPNGWTPLLHAVHVHNAETVHALLLGGADPDASGASELRPLVMAAGYGDTASVRLLLEAGAEADGDALLAAVAGSADLDDFTLGHCQTATVRALLAHDPSLRLPAGAAGWWARRQARWRGCDEVVALLERRPPPPPPPAP